MKNETNVFGQQFKPKY